MICNEAFWSQVHNLTVNLMLEAALNAFRAEFLEKFPAEKAATMQRATDAIAQEFKSEPLLDLMGLKFTAPTGICSLNFCMMVPINAPITMVVQSKIAPDFYQKRSQRW